MKIRNLVKRYSGLAKLADLICYSQTVNFAFIKQRSILTKIFNTWNLVVFFTVIELNRSIVHDIEHFTA